MIRLVSVFGKDVVFLMVCGSVGFLVGVLVIIFGIVVVGESLVCIFW